MVALTKVCEDLGVKISCKYGAVEVPEGWMPGTHPYKVTLRLGKRQLTVPFFQGSGRTDEPTAADVLYCLAIDARAGEETFEDFCSNLGYDPDSRKAEATWRQCKAIAPKLRRFLGDHFDTVADAEH